MDVPGQDIICRGVITAKRQEDGKNLVDLDIWTEKPDGEKTIAGQGDRHPAVARLMRPTGPTDTLTLRPIPRPAP